MSTKAGQEPLYPRLLHLRHISPSSWQRAVLGEGMVGVGALLAMADLASAWGIVVLPVAVAGVVKAHDVLAGALGSRSAAPAVAADEVAVVVDAEPEPERNVRTFRGPRPTTDSAADTAPARPGSADLWTALAAAKRHAERAALPFALVETDEGWAQAVPPAEASARLTPEELAGALREGLAAVAPLRAVLAYEGAQGVGLVGWEHDLAEGVVTDGERVLGAVPPIHT